LTGDDGDHVGEEYNKVLNQTLAVLW